MKHVCHVYHPLNADELNRLANDRQWLQLIMARAGWPGPLHVQRFDMGCMLIEGMQGHQFVTRFEITTATG